LAYGKSSALSRSIPNSRGVPSFLSQCFGLASNASNSDMAHSQQNQHQWEALAACLSGLRILTLANFSEDLPTFLAAVARSCTQLTKLDLDVRLPCSTNSFQALPKALKTLGARHALPALHELHLRLRFTDEFQVGLDAGLRADAYGIAGVGAIITGWVHGSLLT
jgi:hypothetical protein